jgi:hypothetical protein
MMALLPCPPKCAPAFARGLSLVGVAFFLSACGGGSGTQPSRVGGVATPAATPLPTGIAAGTALQIASGETGEAIDGATVAIGGQTFTSVGGRVTLTDRVALRAEVTVAASGMLERRTLVRDVNTTRFTLWPERSPTGMDPDFTQNIVYSHPDGPGPLRRLARGITRVVVIPSEALRGDLEMQAHQEAADRVTAASGGQVVYVLGAERPASGSGYVETRIGGSEDTLCNQANVLGFDQDFTRNGEIVHSLIVYCDPGSARNAVVSHEMGHTFGLHHSPEKGELMYAFFNGHGAVEFSAREGLEMRLMLQRPGGNVYPDDDRGVSSAGATATYTTICVSGR